SVLPLLQLPHQFDILPPPRTLPTSSAPSNSTPFSFHPSRPILPPHPLPTRRSCDLSFNAKPPPRGASAPSRSSSSPLVRPPGSCHPTPGAWAGSSTSMSTLRKI